MFKIATWNVNSLRIRLEQVLNWLDKNKPHVLALQETKTQDKDFPLEAIRKAGYNVAFVGQKTFNGVALLSKDPLEELIYSLPGTDDTQKRIICATIAGIRVVCVYVPNGADLDTDRYIYKLDWLLKLKDFIKEQLKHYDKLVVLGDFNIAPQDKDVYDPKIWHDRILVSPKEREAFKTLLSEGLSDAFRVLDNTSGGFSWWDYRLAAFKRHWGLRLDVILISSALKTALTQCYVDKGPRGLERPSDHTPVVAEFDIDL